MKVLLLPVFTILADSDDTNDPVVDTARAILDGHIVLSRDLAQIGIFPAIDLNQSLSRVIVQLSQRNTLINQNLSKSYILYIKKIKTWY